MRWMAVLALFAASGCENRELDWCTLRMDAKSSEEMGLGDDPAFVGLDVCTGGFDASFCRQIGGKVNWISAGERGYEEYCPLNGYPVACHQELFLKEGETCPEGYGSGTE